MGIGTVLYACVLCMVTLKCIHNAHLCGVVAVNTHTRGHTHNYGLVAVPIRGITDVYKAAARSDWAHFAHSQVVAA